MIYKLIEKIDDKKNRELKLYVYYEKGFYNGWTSQDVKRGVKLIVTCVTVEDRGSYKMEQIDVFGKGNFNMHLESLARKSAKKLEYWENKRRAKSCLKFKRVKDCGILNRLWVTIGKDGTYKADYCAGQDYDSEMRTIRRLLTEQY